MKINVEKTSFFEELHDKIVAEGGYVVTIHNRIGITINSYSSHYDTLEEAITAFKNNIDHMRHYGEYVTLCNCLGEPIDWNYYGDPYPNPPSEMAFASQRKYDKTFTTYVLTNEEERTFGVNEDEQVDDWSKVGKHFYWTEAVTNGKIFGTTRIKTELPNNKEVLDLFLRQSKANIHYK